VARPRADDPGGSSSPARQTITRIADWSDSGSSVTTLAVSPVNIGDRLVFSAAVFSGGTITAGPTGGGVTAWVPVTSGKFCGQLEAVYQWQGVVTATGASNITVTLSGSFNTMLMATELNTPITAPKWYVYGSTCSGEYTGVVSGWYAPILTPQGDDNEMYLAFVATGNGGLSMPGFVFGGGTTVFNGGFFAGFAVVASLLGVAYPTNLQFVCNANLVNYAQIGCLIYATT
jgi:hypothetical protein